MNEPVMLDTKADGSVILFNGGAPVVNPPECVMSRCGTGRPCFHYTGTLPTHIIVDSVWLDEMNWQLQIFKDRKVMGAKRAGCLIIAFDSIWAPGRLCAQHPDQPVHRHAYRLYDTTWPHSEDHAPDIDIMLGIRQ